MLVFSLVHSGAVEVIIIIYSHSPDLIDGFAKCATNLE